MNTKLEDGVLTIELEGRIDTKNSDEIQEKINSVCSQNDYNSIILDADKLIYISSSGLRIILRLRKMTKHVKIINASSGIYEILEMTGFTRMLPVEKAYRCLSVEGCEVIGSGAKGKVYRLDPETIIKVYKNPDSLEDIHKERELARTAFILGVPTAISYDVVKVGDYYGSVFELLNASSLSEILSKDLSRLDECVERSVELLKTIHSTHLEDDHVKGESIIIPDMKEIAFKWVNNLKGTLPDDVLEKLKSYMTAVSDSDIMLHRDYQINNIMVQDGETLLIDMDTLCHGDPIFELATMFAAYVGFAENCPGETMEFFGLSTEVCKEFWEKSLSLYLGYPMDTLTGTHEDSTEPSIESMESNGIYSQVSTVGSVESTSLETTSDSSVKSEDSAEDKSVKDSAYQIIRNAEDKVKVIAYTRLISWMIRHEHNKTEVDRKRMKQYKEELLEVLDKVEDLRLPV